MTLAKVSEPPRYVTTTDENQLAFTSKRNKLDFRDFFGGYFTANVMENSGGDKPSKPAGASLFFTENGGDYWELVN